MNGPRRPAPGPGERPEDDVHPGDDAPDLDAPDLDAPDLDA